MSRKGIFSILELRGSEAGTSPAGDPLRFYALTLMGGMICYCHLWRSPPELAIARENICITRLGAPLRAEVEIYTDGSFCGNSKLGGCGIAIPLDKIEVFAQAFPMGVISASFESDCILISLPIIELS